MPKRHSRGQLPVPVELIEQRIYLVRGNKVMRDTDLARLYGVETFNLNKAVKRNIDRFPEDFMFQLTTKEAEGLTFQIGMSNAVRRGGRRTLPYVFTEQGVAMLSTVLNSERAIKVNIAIMRAFVKMRGMMASHRELGAKLDLLERKYLEHDTTIEKVFEAIRELMEPKPVPQTRRIGFVTKLK
jgi:hypothetical protein